MPFDPTTIARRLRVLHRAGHLTHAEYVVADTLLWSCRVPGRPDAQVSYRRLARLAHVATSKAQAAIRRLRELGVLTWRKTRLRVAWSLGTASRQWRNVYTLVAVAAVPRTDTSQRPADRKQVSKKASDALEQALGRLGSALSDPSLAAEPRHRAHDNNHQRVQPNA
jgi:DNA-binding MurR/RpiR family transcriptional regulator